MKHIFLFGISLGLLTTFSACKRSDNEPVYPASPISRLYISSSDVETSDTQPYDNIAVIDPADSAGYFPNNIYSYPSQPNQGMGILFDPYLGRAYQVSRLDSTIRSFTVAENGTLSPSTNFRDTVRLHSARAIRYNRVSDQLLVTDDYPDTPAIHLFYNPTRLAQQQHAQYRALLSKRPWAMALSNDSDSTLMVSTIGDDPQILEFKIADLNVDNEQVSPLHSMTITGASTLRGIAYSPRLDLLLVADIGPLVSNTTTDGKVYIIENAKQALAAGGTITPTRTISGNMTTLQDPVDIAIDDRNGRPNYIYVADRSQRRICRFPIDANGNIAPDARSASLQNTTIEFIYLDARGGESVQNGQ